MALWTDVIDPATLTGYARAALADYEARKGTLAQWLPNQTVSDVVVRFVAGSTGLVEEAKFRAYDAEPEIGKGVGGKRVTLELPALGRNIPVSEYQQLRSRNASDDAMLVTIQKNTAQVVRSVADRIERLRGVVLNTGKATIDQDNFKSDDDFGRPGSHTVTAATLWSDPAADRLADLQAWVDVYTDTNGEAPGSIVLSTRAIRALAAGNQFKNQLIGGATRPSTEDDVRAILAGAGLPPLYKFDRRVQSGGVSTKVLADDKILLLPAPVAADDAQGTDLGGTFWGQTLTSMDPSYGIEDAEQPGIVAGVYRNSKPPMIAEVIADAIALPVLANASLSFSAKVL
jgi:hypothetical protein